MLCKQSIYCFPLSNKKILITLINHFKYCIDCSSGAMKIYKLCPFSQINNICLWAIEGEGEPEVSIIHSLIKNRTPSQGKKSLQNVKNTEY